MIVADNEPLQFDSDVSSIDGGSYRANPHESTENQQQIPRRGTALQHTEIARDLGKRLLGIRIHKLKDEDGQTSRRGKNPFDYVADRRGRPLSESVEVFDPPGKGSRAAYQSIAQKLAEWFG